MNTELQALLRISRLEEEVEELEKENDALRKRVIELEAVVLGREDHK